MRAGGVALAVLALAASAVEVSRDGKERVAPAVSAAVRDSLAAELERCNAIMPASGRDEACERAWAENRRRFLGASRQPAGAAATESAASLSAGSRP